MRRKAQRRSDLVFEPLDGSGIQFAMSDVFVFRSRMPASAEGVYRFHLEHNALERLTPPWEKAKVVARTGGIETPGSRVTLRVSVGPFSQDWISEHTACEPGRMFRDVMSSGPFRRWEHTHLFEPETQTSSWLEDRVEYEFPLGWLGKLFGGRYTRQRLQKMFEWRHKMTAEILAERAREEEN
jgi:ligand-binding SRPBCC domain-containing protein